MSSFRLRPCVAVLCLWSVFVGQMAHAARPMVTDDARTVDARACQLESWIQYRLGDAEYWALPACNLSGNLEVSFGGAVTREVSRRTRLTDVMLQGKTMFKTLEPDSWALGLAAGNLRRPHMHSDRSLVGDVYFYVPASFAFGGERIVVHLNLGWRYEKEWRHHHIRWGVGFEVQLGERSWLIAESFSEDNSGSFFQMGLRLWVVPEHIQLDATLGDHLFRSRPTDRWFSIGLRLISPALWQ